MSAFDSEKSVYQTFASNPEFFRLYLSLAISALEYPESSELFLDSQRFPSWAQVDQSVLPSYLGSVPNLADLANYCFDEETFYQAFAYTYGPEYANIICSLFGDLIGSAPVSLTLTPNSGILNLPAGSKVFKCCYQPGYEEAFGLCREQNHGSYNLCVPLPLHLCFEAVVSGSVWTNATQSMQLVGASDIPSAMQHLAAEDSWLWPFSAFADGRSCIIAVVEATGPAQMVSSTVYRITYATATFLRYLIIVPYQPPVYVPPPAESEIVHDKPLDSQTEEKLAALERAFTGSGSIQTNKRILNEYKAIHTSRGLQGVRVEFEGGSNMYVWYIYVEIKYFDLPEPLKRDFNTYMRKSRRPAEIVFEARFDSGYPQTPPFLRVVSPRFAFHTGHITIGGSICTESLTRNGWTPSRTIESMLIEVISNMGVGNARLDGRNMNIDYSLAEAQEAFHRVARQHGWQ